MLDPGPHFARAARDYRWLLDRGYPGASSLKLVGDRFRLERDGRAILFRGVASATASRARARLLARSIGGRELLVDGYNQAFAVMHYFAGKALFLGSDGLLRDAGASHGRIARAELFERALPLLARRCATEGIISVKVYLDAPVGGSAGHAALFRAAFAAEGIEARTFLERSADFALKSAPPGSAVASSDSAIADALVDALADADAPPLLFDLARASLDAAFGPVDWLDLGRLLEGGESPSGEE